MIIHKPINKTYRFILGKCQEAKIRSDRYYAVNLLIINFIDKEWVKLFFQGGSFDTNRIQNNNKHLYPGNHFGFYPVEFQDFQNFLY